MTTWSISQLYRQSWEITTKHKKLWILGLAVAIFAGGGGGNSSSNFNSDQQNQESQVEAQVVRTDTDPAAFIESDEEQNTRLPLNGQPRVTVLAEPDPSEAGMFDSQASDITTALSAKQIALLEAITPVVSNAFTSLGWQWWFLIIVEFALFIGYVMVFSFVASNWAKAALTLAIDQVVKKPNQELILTTPSLQALTRIPALIWLQIVPALRFLAITLGILLLGVVVIAVFAATSPALSGIVAVVGTVVGAIAFLYYSITLGVTLIWAEKRLVLENTTGRDAFEFAKGIVKGTRRKAIRLGFANVILMFVVQLLGIAIAIPFVLQAISNFDGTIAIDMVITGIAGSLIVIAFYLFASTVLQTFFYTTWYFAYRFVNETATTHHEK